MYDGFDDNGDPIQHGIIGSSIQSSGLTRMPGPCLGIVLRTKYADSKDNLLYMSLQDQLGGAMKASYVEADVLLVYGGCEMFTPCPHAVVLPQGKSSNQGPGKDEPSDFTEDVPNGCTAAELEEYFGGSGRLGLENFSGDWCVVNFIGGLLQTPVITNWFPNPKNKRDAATKSDGARFVLRRNNSELQVDKNGDLHLTHRIGQYLQMRGKTITLKHREGALLNMEEDGAVHLSNKEGFSLRIDKDGVTLTDGANLVELQGHKVRVHALDEGEVNIAGNNIQLVAGSVIASTGSGGKALLNEDLVPVLEDLTTELVKLEGYLTGFAETQGKACVGVLAPLLPGFETLGKLVADLIKTTTTIQGKLAADQQVPTYRTTVLAAE